MVRSSSEVDFFNMDKTSDRLPSPLSVKPHRFQRRRSFRDIQSVVSKMNPEVVKSVIEKGCLGSTKLSLSLPNQTHAHFRFEIKPLNTAPMTIFYNGLVSVFNVSPTQAQDIMKIAEEMPPKPVEYSKSISCEEKNLLDSLNGGDLRIPRRNSLPRFLEKRKERIDVNED